MVDDIVGKGVDEGVAQGVGNAVGVRVDKTNRVFQKSSKSEADRAG